MRDDDYDDDDDDRGPSQTSGKAIWSLVLGLLSFGLVFVTGLPAVILGMMAVRDVNRSRGRISGSGLAVGGIVTGGIGSLLCTAIYAIPALLLGVAIPGFRDAASRMSSMNNLKQMGLAMHNHHDAYGHLPPAAITGKDGKPLLSWRVAILPYIEHDNLYRQFKLDEPWDSPHNKTLLPLMPKTYLDPKAPPTQPGMTYYQVFVGPGTPFEPGKKIKISDMPDGTSNTILVAEGANPVPWTKPDDLPYSPNAPVPPLADFHSNGRLVVTADGATYVVPKKASESGWRAAITRSDGIVLPTDFFGR